MHQNSEYQLIYVLNDARDTRLALDSDCSDGAIAAGRGKALPFQLSAQALQKGDRFLWRESLRSYQNKALHHFLARWIYSGSSLFTCLKRLSCVGRSLSSCSYLFRSGRTSDVGSNCAMGDASKALFWYRELSSPRLWRGMGSGLRWMAKRSHSAFLGLPKISTSSRRRHRCGQVHDHSPDPVPGCGTRTQCNRLRPGLRVHPAVL